MVLFNTYCINNVLSAGRRQLMPLIEDEGQIQCLIGFINMQRTMLETHLLIRSVVKLIFTFLSDEVVAKKINSFNF